MAALALGACKVDTTTGASGGTSATVTTSATSGTGGEQAGVGGSGAGDTSSTATGAGGGGACDPSLKCGVAVTDPQADANKLCDGTESQMLYDALASCTCTGACKDVCADNECTGTKPATTECQTCVLDTNAGCGNEFQACSNDI